MPHYKFDQIAYNITDKKMPEPGDEKMYIGLEHLDSGSLKVNRWGSEVELKGQKLVMKKGDILFGRRNTYLRRAAIAPHDGIFSAHGMIFRPKTDVIDPEYFPFFISSNYFMDAAIRISVGSLSPTVNWKTLKELEFDIPSLEEQRKNAELLASINETKEAYQELLLQTDNLVKSQFIEMSEHADGKPTRMGDIATYINGAAFKPKDWSPVGKPIIRIQNLNDPSASYNYFAGTIDEKYLVHPGEVLVSWATHLEAYVWSGEEAWLNQHIFRTVFDKKDVNRTFFIYAANAALKEAFKKAHGFKKTMEHIKRCDFEDAIVYLPDKTTQELFATFAEQADKSKFELKEAIKSCDALMKAILFTNLEEKED